MTQTTTTPQIIAKEGGRITLTGMAVTDEKRKVMHLELRDPPFDPQRLQTYLNLFLKDHRIEKVQVEGCTLDVFFSETGMRENLDAQQVIRILQDI
ncbi:hypothetical protein KC852_03350 [Candidatus Nomurabacteria bacterium]|nr:hypothetical protein [Candidatus Nomurabacteria bacterium]